MEDSSSSGSPDQTVPMGTPAKPRDCVMNTGTTLAPNNNSFSFRSHTDLFTHRLKKKQTYFKTRNMLRPKSL